MANAKTGRKADRDSAGRFLPGRNGGPGRPQHSLRAELKRIGDPREVARIVWDWIIDEKMAIADRKWAMEFYANRTEGKPVAHVEATIERSAQGDDRPLTDVEFAAMRTLLEVADNPDAADELQPPTGEPH